MGLSASPQVGDPFRFATPKGDVLTGTVDFVTDTRTLGLVVREYDDALLRFTMEGKEDAPSTFFYGYAIAYGAERERASDLLAAGRGGIQ